MGPNDANEEEEEVGVGVVVAAEVGPPICPLLTIVFPLPYTPVRTPATIREIKPLAPTPIALERAVNTLDDMRAATNTQERGPTTVGMGIEGRGVVYRAIGQEFNIRGMRNNPNKEFWDPFAAIVVAFNE